jgi:hypothetical protein
MKTQWQTVLPFSVLCSLIFATQPLPAQSMKSKSIQEQDLAMLSSLNARFIQNFINEDTVAHNAIIHHDFICIESSGAIVNREAYMQEWATGYRSSDYRSFSMTDEFIRIFGNTALVRARTVFTKIKGGVTTTGSSIYTDTYIKEQGKWLCVQAQITAVR